MRKPKGLDSPSSNFFFSCRTHKNCFAFFYQNTFHVVYLLLFSFMLLRAFSRWRFESFLLQNQQWLAQPSIRLHILQHAAGKNHRLSFTCLLLERYKFLRPVGTPRARKRWRHLILKISPTSDHFARPIIRKNLHTFRFVTAWCFFFECKNF